MSAIKASEYIQNQIEGMIARPGMYARSYYELAHQIANLEMIDSILFWGENFAFMDVDPMADWLANIGRIWKPFMTKGSANVLTMEEAPDPRWEVKIRAALEDWDTWLTDYMAKGLQ